MVIVWGIAIVVFAIAELATVGLVSIWFVVGSIAGLVTELLGGALWLQFVLFLAVSVITLILTRPLAKKFINGKRKPTNADRVFEMTALVTEEIDNFKGTGLVRVDGKVWSARSLTGEKISTGEAVKPVEIQGVKLIVVKKEEKAEITL